MELANRANVLAEGGSLEDAIDQESRDEIAQDDPGGCAGAVPKGKGLIRPKVRGEQAGRNPLRAQSSWPAMARGHELSGQIARKCEWTRHAKKIAGHQQCDDGQSSPVSPGQHTSQVHRRDLWTKEPIDCDNGG